MADPQNSLQNPFPPPANPWETFTQGYKPLSLVDTYLKQQATPGTMPSWWTPSTAAPVQGSGAGGFDFNRDMPGLMPNSTPFANTPNNAQIAYDAGFSNSPGGGGFMSGIGDWMKSSGFLGGKNADGTQSQGWGGIAVGGAQALGNLYMGMQQYNLAKDALANNKDQFERNYAAQRTTTNGQLEDRQRSRINSSAPGAYESVDSYMNKHRVA